MRLYLLAATCLKDSHRAFLSDNKLTWRETPVSSDAERLTEIAGRVCYLSFGDRQSPRGNADYIHNLIAQSHESVLEHATFTILADGISRALSHQLVRHRVGFSYSQLSQQYHDESRADFVIPPELECAPDAAREWKAATETALRTYTTVTQQMIESNFGLGLGQRERQRAIRSIARSVLPNATQTMLVVTGNARAWRHVLSVRGAIKGDPEMRRYCVECFKLLQSEAPALFATFRIIEDEIGGYVTSDKD